uniref:Uncharacterized protein n=1 Tax=Lactuca sativa TaxID=4236 RepID=A0A9R1VMV2_LACSA|nr:hypothetical protein LSAT_V11C400222820 [Lactuca sativa]
MEINRNCLNWFTWSFIIISIIRITSFIAIFVFMAMRPCQWHPFVLLRGPHIIGDSKIDVTTIRVQGEYIRTSTKHLAFYPSWYNYFIKWSLSFVHWVLLVICPSSRVTYILDSLMKPKQNPLDTCYLLKLLDMAFARHEKTHQLQLYGCSLRQYGFPNKRLDLLAER